MGDIQEIKESDPEVMELTDGKGFIIKNGYHIPYFDKKFESQKKYETRHDIPCPSGMGTAVAEDHDINEWVFNHLPLKEDQKKILWAGYKKEELGLVPDREKEVLESRTKELVKKRRGRRVQPKEREGVKETHKSKEPGTKDEPISIV